jgi:hypothetical protein
VSTGVTDISQGADIAMLTGLPEGGLFVVTAKAQFDFQRTEDTPSTFINCTLTLEDAGNVTGPFVDGAGVSLIVESRATLPLSTVADLPSGGTAVLNCTGNRVRAGNVTLIAIQVATLTPMP